MQNITNQKTIYLHIGMPKTGTTAIQTFLFENRKKLESYGLIYPMISSIEQCKDITSNDVPNLRPLFRSYADIFARVKEVLSIGQKKTQLKSYKTKKWYKAQFTKLFMNQISKSECNTIILSEESLSDVYLNSRENLIDALLELQFKIKIIVYIRPTVERLTSHWCERMRPYSSLNKDIIEYLDTADIDCEHIFPLIDKLGKENVIVKPFEKVQWKDNNFIADFLHIFNIDLNKNFKVEDKKVRVSSGRNTIELFKIITALRLQNKQYWVEKSFNINIKDVKVIETLTDEQILKTTLKHAPALKKLANIYGRESFFINELPKCYGQKRPIYSTIAFSPEQQKILYEALDEKAQQESVFVRFKIFIKNLRRYSLRFLRLCRINF